MFIQTLQNMQDEQSLNGVLHVECSCLRISTLKKTATFSKKGKLMEYFVS